MANNLGTWDLPSLNYRNPSMGSSVGNNSSCAPVYNSNSMLNTPMGRVYTSPAPPVPARPVRNTYNSSYNSYTSPFNSCGYGGYTPSFGSYGGYGGYGFGSYRPSYGSYGYGSGGYYGNSYPENRFIQMAEESSRPAFQSIQSILHAFSSVTMMFESSFHAIYSSYMSVLGVADNFGKLRTVFGQVFSTFALFKSLGWLFRKILYYLGINKEDFTKESVWSDALGEVSEMHSNNSNNKKRTWPMLLFMSILIGGPYLLFKLISELHPNPVQEMWVPSENPGSLAVGLYDFNAASDQELSFSAQQKLMIAPKKFQPFDCPGWLLACNDSRKIGLIPNNYIGMMMQSEKTGQTYIEHNGQTYQHSARVADFGISPNSFESAQSTLKGKVVNNDLNNVATIKDNEKLEKISEKVEE